jgi:hypothetical protein
MAVKKEELEADSAAARSRPIELITENGFSIVRATEIGGANPSAHEYMFVVGDPNGYQLEIVVRIDQAAFKEVLLASRGRISSASSYWVACAERHLADYLGEHDDYPPDATLRVERLTPRDRNLVGRWETT